MAAVLLRLYFFTRLFLHCRCTVHTGLYTCTLPHFSCTLHFIVIYCVATISLDVSYFYRC